MLKWLQEHSSALIGLAAIILGLATIYAGNIGRPWNSSTEPDTLPTAEAQPDPVETVLDRGTKPSDDTRAEPSPESSVEMPLQPNALATPPALALPPRDPVDFKSCETIDRSGRDVLSQSIFSVRDTMGDMARSFNYTALEIERFAAQYHGLRVIDCGYVSDISRNSLNGLSVVFGKAPAEFDIASVYCSFDGDWDSKLTTHDRSRRVAFEGIIGTNTVWMQIYLNDCRILKVE